MPRSQKQHWLRIFFFSEITKDDEERNGKKVPKLALIFFILKMMMVSFFLLLKNWFFMFFVSLFDDGEWWKKHTCVVVWLNRPETNKKHLFVAYSAIKMMKKYLPYLCVYNNNNTGTHCCLNNNKSWILLMEKFPSISKFNNKSHLFTLNYRSIDYYY